ncbi:hypothetical protein C4040_18805 [Clostridioides difficile]|nr:hypothetical protein [Clostridioides difficile]
MTTLSLHQLKTCPIHYTESQTLREQPCLEIAKVVTTAAITARTVAALATMGETTEATTAPATMGEIMATITTVPATMVETTAITMALATTEETMGTTTAPETMGEIMETMAGNPERKNALEYRTANQQTLLCKRYELR